MPTSPDPAGLPESSPFPDGFGYFDPPPVFPDPTAAPPPPVLDPPRRTPSPAEPPPESGSPPELPPPPAPVPVVTPPAATGGVKLLIWTVFGPVFVFAFCGVLFPLASNLWDGGSDDQADGGIDGFEDIGESAEPLTATELYSEDSYTFRIELAERVIEGELHLIEAFDHPDCAAARTEAAERVLVGCGSRIEAAYTGADEGLRVSQQVLMFEDEADAQAFGSLIEDQFAAEVLSFEDPGDIDGSGYAASRSGVEGQYVVVTLVVSDSGDEAAITVAEEHAHARHAESLSYLIWR